MVFKADKFVIEAEEYIKKTVASKKAIIALSGGVDSFVAATIAARAIPKQLLAVYVNTGLMRKNESENVRNAAEKAGIKLNVINAEKEFFAALKGVLEPEEKRKIIGELFIRLFEREAKESNAEFLIQGTIAPDWIESGGMGRDKINSHHNVAGLP